MLVSYIDTTELMEFIVHLVLRFVMGRGLAVLLLVVTSWLLLSFCVVCKRWVSKYDLFILVAGQVRLELCLGVMFATIACVVTGWAYIVTVGLSAGLTLHCIVYLICNLRALEGNNVVTSFVHNEILISSRTKVINKEFIENNTMLNEDEIGSTHEKEVR